MDYKLDLNMTTPGYSGVDDALLGSDYTANIFLYDLRTRTEPLSVHDCGLLSDALVTLIGAHRGEVEELERQVAEAQAEAGEKEDECEDLRLKNYDLKTEIEVLTAELEKATSMAVTANTSVANLNDELAVTRQMLERIDTELSSQIAETATVKRAFELLAPAVDKSVRMAISESLDLLMDPMMDAGISQDDAGMWLDMVQANMLDLIRRDMFKVIPVQK
jgi:hypothetical protein